MGLGRTMEYFSGIMNSGHHHKQKKLLQTVELKVRMDCEGCERKVNKVISSLHGVKSVAIDRKMQKVTVTGYADAKKVLKRAQSTGKKTELWPYVPYDLVAQPYTAESYDKKAPAGYVRKDLYANAANVTRQNDQYNMFSDDNPNACSVM